MVFNGTWFMGDVDQSAIKDKVFFFPYMKDKPQIKDHNIIFPQNLSIGAKLGPEERDAAVAFLKYYSSKAMQQRMAYDTKNLPARNDIALDPAKTGALFNAVNKLAGTIKVFAKMVAPLSMPAALASLAHSRMSLRS
jgi:ABC-type glycerol-3-phosphate transport system substrate-binding protein